MVAADNKARTTLQEPRELANRRSTSLPRPVPLASLVTLIAVWELTAWLLGVNPSTGATMLPSLEETFGAFKSFANYWPGGFGAGDTRLGAPITYWGAVLGLVYNTYVSLLRLSMGWILGVITGIGLACVISWSRLLRDALLFPAHLMRMMPLLAMIPLFALWFGDRPVGAVVFVGFSVFVLLFIVTITAISNLSIYYEWFALSLGASNLRIYLTVVLPAALPQIRPGVMLSLGFSWSAVVAAEFLGQQYGLGRIAVYAQEFGKVDTMALVAVIVVSLAAISYVLVGRLLGWLTRWAEP